MLVVLDTPDKSIVAKLNHAATTQPDFVASFYDSYETNIEELSTDGSLNSTSYVTLVASPVAGRRRVVKDINLHNKDNTDHIFTVYLKNGDDYRVIWKGLITQTGTKKLATAENFYVEYIGSAIPDGGSDGKYIIYSGGSLLWTKLAITQEGAKSSATDAGEFGEVSADDDFIYVCRVAGEAGSAVWKRFQLHLT